MYDRFVFPLPSLEGREGFTLASSWYVARADSRCRHRKDRREGRARGWVGQKGLMETRDPGHVCGPQRDSDLPWKVRPGPGGCGSRSPGRPSARHRAAAGTAGPQPARAGAARRCPRRSGRTASLAPAPGLQRQGQGVTEHLRGPWQPDKQRQPQHGLAGADPGGFFHTMAFHSLPGAPPSLRPGPLPQVTGGFFPQTTQSCENGCTRCSEVCMWENRAAGLTWSLRLSGKMPVCS